MAIIEYGAIITDIKGSIGGVTFQHNSAGKIARLKSSKFKSQSEKARYKHYAITSNINSWQKLTLDEQQEWNAYAKLHTKYDKFGKERTLTGINWHFSINYNLVKTGGVYTSTPPIYVLPEAIPTFKIELSSTAINIIFSPGFTPANTALKIFATTPLITGSMNFDKYLKYIQVDVTCACSKINITADWESATGLDYSDSFSSGAFFIGVLIEPVEITSGVSWTPTRSIQTTVERIMTFYTNKNGNFTPIITTSDASIGKWTVEGFVSQTSNTPNFALTGASLWVTLEIIDFSKVTSFNVASENLENTLDISLLTNITDFQANTNPLLTKIINPISSAGIVFTKYWAYSCDLTGILDLSGLTGLGGDLRIFSNPNLTGITNPISSEAFTAYSAYSCDITGTLDLSGLTGLGGDLRLYSNSNLTGVTNPTSPQVFTIYHIYSCNLTGTFDLSGLTGLGGELRCESNSNLTGITNPVSSQIFTIYRLDQCDITGTLNLSGLTNLGGFLNVFGNSNLTGITNPISSRTFTTYSAVLCNLTGTLDLSSLTGLGGGLYLYSNALLTSVVFPASNKAFSTIEIYSCAIGVLIWNPLTGAITAIDIKNNAFTSAESDENIVNIDVGINITTSLNIAGTNGVLTNGAVTGFDGITAKDNLVAAGVAVTFN